MLLGPDCRLVVLKLPHALNHMAGLLKYAFLGPTPNFLIQEVQSGA